MNIGKKRVLVLGATGMLGNAVIQVFCSSPGYEAIGSARSAALLKYLPQEIAGKLIIGHDLENQDQLIDLFYQASPDIVINCVGLVKQLSQANDPIQAILINALLPHRLARLAALSGARLVHMSTDCVFSGSKGDYTEEDLPDAYDLYGRSKLLGEVDYPNAITLRTSIIGHELNGARSLINWFLLQEGSTKGYEKAIFSGLPTVEIARLIRDHVLTHPELRGLYHVSADPINKFDLLSLVARVYGKTIDIKPDDSVSIDRSLNSTRFRRETGYQSAPWPDLVNEMFQFQMAAGSC